MKIHPNLNDASNMERNWIQFPRLLHTIVLTQGLNIPAIAEHMDLSLPQVYDLFYRADKAHEANQQRSK